MNRIHLMLAPRFKRAAFPPVLTFMESDGFDAEAHECDPARRLEACEARFPCSAKRRCHSISETLPRRQREQEHWNPEGVWCPAGPIRSQDRIYRCCSWSALHPLCSVAPQDPKFAKL